MLSSRARWFLIIGILAAILLASRVPFDRNLWNSWNLVTTSASNKVDEEESEHLENLKKNFKRSPQNPKKLENQIKALPQDAPWEVSGFDSPDVHQENKLTRLMARLELIRLRRPTAFDVSLKILAAFAKTHAFLMETPLMETGNTRRHEMIRQRLTSMVCLRIELLEGLNACLFEIGGPVALTKKTVRVIGRIRDETHELARGAIQRWRSVLPDVGNGMPPFALPSRPSRMDAFRLYV
jgi:hypothetical protein